jgi:hypothetical protein
MGARPHENPHVHDPLVIAAGVPGSGAIEQTAVNVGKAERAGADDCELVSPVDVEPRMRAKRYGSKDRIVNR